MMPASVGFVELSWAGGVFDAAGHVAFRANGAVEVYAITAPGTAQEMVRVMGGRVEGANQWVVPPGQQVAVLGKLQPYLRNKMKRELASRAMMYRAVGGRGRRESTAVKTFRDRLRDMKGDER